MGMDRDIVKDELLEAQRSFHQLLDSATVADLRRSSNGTRWNNGQLLFHMYFGYLIVVRLRLLVLFFARLPDAFSRGFARTLDVATGPFHVINFVASVAGSRVFGYLGLANHFDRVIGSLLRHLETEDESDLARGMHYPTSWDPYFRDYMTLADLYRYPTQHFEHHSRQLSLNGGEFERGDLPGHG